uniref:RanBP2-type domain-containing protein n=1 Tax=Globodera pallida TaxID=36090 RepID=A0A183C5R2_GLOPA
MIIEEIGAIEDFGKNLSFGSTTMSTTAPPALSSDRLVEDAAPRWSCPSCTYLNCRRTKRCVICDTERPSRFVDQTPPGSGENQTNRNETFGGGAQFVLSKELLNKCSNDISALPCALNCMARTRLYTRVTQCMAFRDGAATFKCQFVAHPHNFSILKLPPQSAGSCADDLALTVPDGPFSGPAPSIPPQFCYLDCFDSMANRGGVIVGRPPNFLMRNRGGPNTLYDAIFQCMFGVCDRFNILRSALKYTLRRSSHLFKIRWLDAQLKMARDCGLSAFGQGDMENDWADVLNAVDADDECPEPIHIWALAHVVCRPIVVHSMDDPIDVDQLLAAVNSQSMPGGDETDANLALAKRQHNAPQNHYEGIYLPVLWASPPVTRSPLFICHRNGHFHAVVVSDDIYQRDFEVQRYLRIVRRAPRRPGVPEPLFRFLTRAEADNSAFLSQFVLFGECSVAHLSIRREAHPFLPEALALYRGWLHALLQAADDMEAAPTPCSTRAAVMPQLATRIDAHAQQQQHQKNWRAHAHNTAVSALLAPAVTQQQAGATAAPISRQRSFAYSSATGRLQQQQQDADGDEQRQHSDGEE